MSKTELDLNNPIFVFYVDTTNMPRQRAEETLMAYKGAFDIYSNVTTWIIASDRSDVQCVYDGKYKDRDSELSELIKQINSRIDILSTCKSFDDFKVKIRDWRIESIIDGEEKG